MFADYELKVNRAYLFFWPTYKGRSDWKVQGPLPLSCSAKLETMPKEAYWPGLAPAGRTFGEEADNPNLIHIGLNSVGKLEKWDLVLNLDYRFGEGAWKKTSKYQKNKNNLNLDYTEGPNWGFTNVTSEYYWVEENDGRISTFIECYAVSPKIEAYCHQS